MKKFIFSFLFLGMLVAGAQAQTQKCSKPCSKSAAASSCQSKAGSVASTNTTLTPENANAAAKLASLDPTIEARTCPVTGNVSYVRKQTCAHSGTVTYTDLSYDASTSTFVNVSPVKGEGSGTGCSKSATTTSGKACCASGASAGKSCCAGKSGSKAEKVKS